MVPATPIAAPVITKMRMIAPRVAPMVRRMAMSRPLSFTSMIRPEMMLSAATRMISVRIMNMTLRSTCSAEKNEMLRCCQSVKKVRPADRVRNRLFQCLHGIGIVDVDLDRPHLAFGVEKELRLLQRQVDDGGIVFAHADLEDRRHRIGLDARRCAERRDVAFRIDDRHQCRPAAGRGCAPAARRSRRLRCRSKPSSEPCWTLGAMLGIFFSSASRMPRMSAPDPPCVAPETSAGCSISGIASRTPVDAGNALRHLVIVGQVVVDRLHDHVAVEAKDAVEKLGAKTVHDGHDDDQRRDAEHDADEGKSGDDRNEGFLAPRPQIAPGHHPLERRERPRRPGGRGAHCGIAAARRACWPRARGFRQCVHRQACSLLLRC